MTQACDRPAPNFRTLFESGAGICVVVEPHAPQFTIVAVSNAYTEARKMRREDLLGRGFFESFTDQTQPDTAWTSEMMTSLEKVARDRVHDVILTTGNEFPRSRAECCIRRYSNSPVLGAEGDLAYIVHRVEESGTPAVVSPTAPVKSLGETIQLSVSKLAGIAAICADAVVFVDEAKRIAMFNEGAEKIFGYAQAEIVGAPMELLIPERFRIDHHLHVERFESGTDTARLMGTRGAEIFGLRKNGEEFPADAAISRLEVDGRSFLIVSMRDISEQKRMEDEERLLAAAGRMLVSGGLHYEHLLANISTSLVGSVADWCAVGMVQSGVAPRVKWTHSDPANTALCEALEQYPLERLLPAPASAEEDTQRPVWIDDPSAEFLASIAHNLEHLRLLETLQTRSMIVVRLVARGHPVGVLAVGSSTASKRYRKQHVRLLERVASLVALALDNARLHEGLERSLRGRDELLGIVAHDLRSPLNAIVLQARALELTRDTGDARAHDGIQRIRRATTEMNHLIQDLLEVTRLEAGQKLSILPSVVEAQSVVAEAVERQLSSVSGSRCTFQISATTETAHALADRARLLQVLNNLLSNAVKFSRGQIAVGAAPYATEVLFWVQDNGPGIPAKDIPVLFDRFWQAARIDRRGAGLGLSIVKGIVESHGGRVWVKSETGVGSTFYFTLPMAPARTQVHRPIKMLPGRSSLQGYDSMSS